MNIAKLIIAIGFFAVVIAFAVENFKKDKYNNKNIFEYVIILLAMFLGAAIAYQYYSDLMPIVLWSVVSGVVPAVIVEARRRRKKDLP